MARIRSKDTQPEMRVRRFLSAAGLRYRLHVRTLPGCPDLVFAGRRTVVQIRGCWWHQHPGCPAARIPKTRTEWWATKFARNVARDTEVDVALVAAGWRVLVIWECETKREECLAALAEDLMSAMT
jgi:DNA mismatch endonuclease (patch repair protein)